MLFGLDDDDAQRNTVGARTEQLVLVRDRGEVAMKEQRRPLLDIPAALGPVDPVAECAWLTVLRIPRVWHVASFRIRIDDPIEQDVAVMRKDGQVITLVEDLQSFVAGLAVLVDSPHDPLGAGLEVRFEPTALCTLTMHVARVGVVFTEVRPHLQVTFHSHPPNQTHALTNLAPEVRRQHAEPPAKIVEPHFYAVKPGLLSKDRLHLRVVLVFQQLVFFLALFGHRSPSLPCTRRYRARG